MKNHGTGCKLFISFLPGIRILHEPSKMTGSVISYIICFEFPLLSFSKAHLSLECQSRLRTNALQAQRTSIANAFDFIIKGLPDIFQIPLPDLIPLYHKTCYISTHIMKNAF